MLAGILLAAGVLAHAPARAQVPTQQDLIGRIAPPAPPTLGAPLAPPEPVPATGPGAEREVPITRVELAGNAALPTAQLRPLLAPLEGATVPLSRLEEARLAVLGAYRTAGYPYVLVSAALSALPDGLALRIVVTEAFVAAVKLDGDIGPAATQVLRLLEPVQQERPISQATLERALLLVTDMPGIAANGVLRPLQGGEPGALELVVRLQRRKVTGFLSVDNRGAPSTGQWQGLAVVGLNGMSSLGERTEISFVQTEGNRQTFGQVSEEVFVGGSGLRVRGWFGMGQVRPGGSLSGLGYLGDTTLGGIGGSYPIIRSRPLNLNASAQVDAFHSLLSTQPTGSTTRSRLGEDDVRAVRASLDGSVRDAVLLPGAGAASTYGLARLSQGMGLLGASANGSATVQRTGADFGFSKVNAEVTRVQPLFRPFEDAVVSVQATVGGQYSGSILPPSEKFYLGGARLGRGFWSGQVSGDSAVATSIELQLNTGLELRLPRIAKAANQVGSEWVDGLVANGQAPLALQLYGFHDQGRSFENKVGDSNRRLAAWGGGVRAILSERVQLDLEALQRMTRTPDGSTTPLRAEAVFFRLLTRF